MVHLNHAQNYVIVVTHVVEFITIFILIEIFIYSITLTTFLIIYSTTLTTFFNVINQLFHIQKNRFREITTKQL